MTAKRKQKSHTFDVLFWLVQLLWGFPQTLAGFCLYRRYKDCPHGHFRETLVTKWPLAESLSLGPFLFVSDKIVDKSFRNYILLHEYGNSRQSLLLGPLYLLIIGVPSIFWCRVPFCGRSWRNGGRSYYSFYTERLANRLSGVEDITWKK